MQTVKIIRDNDAQNPRTEYDNLGTMAAAHRRYDLGDKDGHAELARLLGCDPDDIRTICERLEKRRDIIALPLYLYDHSGITISTTPFSCPWDSGQVGFIFITAEKARAEYGWKVITKARRAKIEAYLKGEVETYDQYLTGDVYGFTVENEEGDEVDACWGFYGQDPDANGIIGHLPPELHAAAREAARSPL